MKLIIDIPESFYKNILICWEKIHPKMWEILKNGKPYEERPQGEWVAREDMDYVDENGITNNHFMCKDCGFIHNFIDGHTSQYNFCPNCGADMRGKEK